MKIGELFAGIGGASLAVGMVYPDAATAWQADLVGEAVRARRFPGAQQLVGDVREVDPARLDRVDLLTAGFPCTDLSVAGRQEGLNGKNSRLYREVLRFCGARRDDLYADDDQDNPRPWRVVFGGGYQPPRVLIENVPALLHYLPRLGADFRALGYGLTWTVCEAADAGHPHLRRRVFVLAELDRVGRGAVEVSQAMRWRPDGLRHWPTALASDAKDVKQNGEGSPSLNYEARQRPEQGRRLSSAWIEALMGYPVGWTDADLDCLHDLPAAVRGRYPEGWDRREPWPGFAWEPPRTLPDGVKAPWRVPRLRALGNAWVPAQGALALRALLAPAQADLFGAR